MLTREMKDSGVEWIGEIPKEWDLSTISRNYNSRVEKVSDLKYKALSVTKNGIVPQLDNAAKSANHNDRKLVLKNDFVINSRSDRKMSSGVSLEDGSVSLINTVIYSNSILPEYSNYLLKNYSFAEEFYRWGTGIVADLWSTNWEKMKKIVIPIPPVDNQKKIAGALDNKGKIIDTILLDTQQSIIELKKYKQALIMEIVTKGLDENVEMKDSGIEWIGKVPEHWQLLKIGNVFNQVKKKNINMLETNLLSLSYGRVIRRSILSSDGLLPESFETYNIVDKGDIVLRMTDLQNDHKSLRTGCVKEKGIITSAYITLRKSNNFIFEEYIALLLHAFDCKKGFYGLGSGVRQNVTFNDVKKISIAVPDSKEQQQIVDFLDEKTSKIDSLIKDKEQIIKEYEDYKKSLIYEYVTGKKQV